MKRGKRDGESGVTARQEYGYNNKGSTKFDGRRR